MDSNRDKIIAKVKKCLALTKSGNEHEAAAALRQAQKLMAAHGISDLGRYSGRGRSRRSSIQACAVGVRAGGAC